MAAAASTLNSSWSREIQLKIWTGRSGELAGEPVGLKVTKVSAPSSSSCPAQRGPRILETSYCPLVATCRRRAGHQLPTAVGESPAPPNCTDGMRFPTEPRSSSSNRPAPGHRLVERGSAGQALVASMGSRPEPYSTGGLADARGPSALFERVARP